MFTNPMQRVAILGVSAASGLRLNVEDGLVSVVSDRPGSAPRLTNDDGIITAEARIQ